MKLLKTLAECAVVFVLAVVAFHLIEMAHGHHWGHFEFDGGVTDEQILEGCVGVGLYLHRRGSGPKL